MMISSQLPVSLADTVERSLKEIFSKQLKLSLEPATSSDEIPDLKVFHASVSITGERVKASVLLQISEAFAAKATKILIGCDGAGEEIEDATGELCNMISGRIKSELTTAGFPGVLGTPTITFGSRIDLRDTVSSESCRTEWVCGTDHINIQMLIHTQP
jgi:CheY-specific phosphatase CheX